MQGTDRTKRRLPISPLVWVAVAGLGVMALYERFPGDPASNTLEYLHKEKTVVVRLPDESFDFPVLGARVAVPRDWVHLSTTNPALAQQPIFLNVTEQLVLTVLPDPLASGLLVVDDAQKATANQELDGIKIQWERDAGPLLSIDVNLDGFKFPIQWNLQTPSRLGRLQSNGLRLILVAYGAGNGVGADAKLRFDAAIADFCRGIHPLPLDGVR